MYKLRFPPRLSICALIEVKFIKHWNYKLYTVDLQIESP
jgi:hypothetical protein